MGVEAWGFESGNVIGEATLIIPETVVEDLEIAPGKILKPMFDLVWNACGYPASRNFDSEGNWVQRR